MFKHVSAHAWYLYAFSTLSQVVLTLQLPVSRAVQSTATADLTALYPGGTTNAMLNGGHEWSHHKKNIDNSASVEHAQNLGRTRGYIHVYTRVDAYVDTHVDAHVYIWVIYE